MKRLKMPGRHWHSVVSITIFSISVVLLQVNRVSKENNLSEFNEGTEVSDSARMRQIRARGYLSHLGFKNLSADLLWLDFIQYFGGVVQGTEIDGDFSYEYLNSIAKFDPRFTEVYLFSTVALAWKQARPDLALLLLHKGAAEISPSRDFRQYRIWYQIALVEALWNGNFLAGVRAFNEAASAIQEIPEERRILLGISFSPDSLRNLGLRLESNPNSTQVRFDLWVQVFNDASSLEAKALAFSQLDALGGIRRFPDGSFTTIRPE